MKRARANSPTPPTTTITPLKPFAVNGLLVAARGSSKLIELIHIHGKNFSAINCATALQRLARSPPSIFTLSDTAALTILVQATIRVLHLSDSISSPPLLNARTLTSICFGLGTLNLLQEDDGLLWDVLENAACRTLELADPALLATLLWVQGIARKRFKNSLIVSAAEIKVHLMTGAEIAAAAGGASRAGLTLRTLWIAFAKRGEELAREKNGFTIQGISALAAAWARAKNNAPTMPPSLLEVLFAATLTFLRTTTTTTVTPADLAELLWAFSRIATCTNKSYLLVRDAILKAVSSQISCLPPHIATSILHTLTAMGGVSDTPLLQQQDTHLLITALATRALTLIHDLKKSDIGFFASAIASRSALPQGGPLGRKSAALQLATRGAELAPTLAWRSVAAIDVALRELSGTGQGDILDAELLSPQYYAYESSSAKPALPPLLLRALEIVDELARKSDAAIASPITLLISSLKNVLEGGEQITKSENQTVLLISDDTDRRITTTLLTIQGISSIYHWRRFAVNKCGRDEGGGDDDDDDGAKSTSVLSWPSSSTSLRKCRSVIIRFPSSIDAFVLALTAATQKLIYGGILIVYGDVREGLSLSVVHAACNTMKKWNKSMSTIREVSCDSDGSVVICAIKKSKHDADGGDDDNDSNSLMAHAHTFLLPLSAPLYTPILSWTTFPGLFAGGGLDVMTNALLNVLPCPTPFSRACDFACGSGTLAAALLQREPTLRFDLIDADAIALTAARLNVPTARKIHPPTDGWPIKKIHKQIRRYHLIVSNPPVHRGQADDLRVLLGLLQGTKERLRTTGVLYLVAQAHIPVGPLAMSVGLQVTAIRANEGRFFIWRCTK